MKVLNLRCANGHVFEGWFASDDDYMDQNGRGLVECPLCADNVVARVPSAPRLNLSGAKAPVQQPVAAARAAAAAAPEASSSGSAAVAPEKGAAAEVSAPAAPAQARQLPAELQAAWFAAARRLVAQTEDVGPRFAEEARRIHYGETPHRGIRGQATPEERLALADEGIETMALPLPKGLDGPLQ